MTPAWKGPKARQKGALAQQKEINSQTDRGTMRAIGQQFGNTSELGAGKETPNGPITVSVEERKNWGNRRTDRSPHVQGIAANKKIGAKAGRPDAQTENARISVAGAGV